MVIAKQGALRRSLGPYSAAMVIVANMVGTGIFTAGGFILAQTGSPSLFMLCWLAGGIIALAGALSYAELGARYPQAGGEYVFLRQSFGPLWGFLSGWISLVVGFSAPIAAAAVAGAGYLLRAWPQAAGWSLSLGGLSLSGESLLALSILLGFTLLHAASLRVGVRVQNLLTGFKLLVLVGLIAAGLGAWDGQGFLSQALVAPGSAAARVATALVFVSFAYSGFNAAAYLGGEIKNPQRNLPLALLTGTGLVTALYLLINLAYLAAVPPEQMAGVKEIGSLTAQALLGPIGGRVFSLLVALCLLSSLGAMTLTGPRIYYAMAQDRVFFAALGRVRPASGVPANSVWLQAAIAALLVLTASFEALLFYIGFILSLFAALSVAGLLVLRRRLGPPDTFRVPLYPWVPLLFIGSNAWIIVFSLAGDPWRALPGALTLAVGVALYLVFRRRNQREQERG
ncbi:MAG: amino acid permease [Proteobacteria bacterium]|nr:amino acid permease [Pseudomonadota bacterium]MBU4383297.1 amino acid permease [Pseudomonadota bacterium]MCG2764336.1 amino acid permease [Desulfarculaceae bacterium]